MYDIIQQSYDETLYCHTTRYHADFYDIIHPPHLRWPSGEATVCTALAPTSKVHNVQLACTLYCSELAACVGGALAVAQRALNKERGQPRACRARRRGMHHAFARRDLAFYRCFYYSKLGTNHAGPSAFADCPAVVELHALSTLSRGTAHLLTRTLPPPLELAAGGISFGRQLRQGSAKCGHSAGPVASPGVPLALRLSPRVQLECWAKGGPWRTQCGGSAQVRARKRRRKEADACAAAAGAHLTNFLVLTRCSHCLPVRLGPLPISICSKRPCELGRSSARPATAHGAPG